jgi:hypothetical protein
MHWVCFLKELSEISTLRQSGRYKDKTAFLSIFLYNYKKENWQFIITYFLKYFVSLFHNLTTIYIFQIYYIYSGIEVASLSVSDVDLYIIIRKLLYYLVNILLLLIRRPATHTGVDIAYVRYNVHWFVEQMDFTGHNLYSVRSLW